MNMTTQRKTILPQQQQREQTCCHNGNATTMNGNHNRDCCNNMEYDDDDDKIHYKNKKYFTSRHSKAYKFPRQKRIQQTVWLFIISLVLLLFTIQFMTNNGKGKHNHRHHQHLPNERDDRFHAKKHHNLGYDPNKKWKRDPVKREERKQKAIERENFNRQQNQQIQKEMDLASANAAAAGGGGIFHKLFGKSSSSSTTISDEKRQALMEALHDLDQRIINNENRGIRWINMDLVPSLPTSSQHKNPLLEAALENGQKAPRQKPFREFFKVKRKSAFKTQSMGWEKQNAEIMKQNQPDRMRDDYVDYTKHQYQYPTKLLVPPTILGEYPKLMPLQEIMDIWPQDELDHPPTPLEEVLIHFDFHDPEDMIAATKFRDAKLPFKIINVPEVIEAGKKWTDDYLSHHFDSSGFGIGGYHGIPKTDGIAQESPDNYFAWYQPAIWNVEILGVPPTRNNDWTFVKWAQHAQYADAVGLHPNQPHFYWQSGVDKEERYKDESEWTFVSHDLPSFSSTTPNFFLFEPESQKGIQCRFGERGVTAATHFDGGRNMVAMMTGAKRYILSPPKECGKLGIVTTRAHPIFRHSMMNFGHLNHMNDPNMPQEEKEWLEIAGTANALSTVLKAGEVLYIPSHWFHYITSLQKSAQCNVRSGIDREGDAVFGGEIDVTEKCYPGGGGGGG